jgi:hypothetical protein
MVIRLVSVSDHIPLSEFHDVFRTILGWNGDLGYLIRVHGQEFNSFRRKARSKALHPRSFAEVQPANSVTAHLAELPAGTGRSRPRRRR